jgi:hypothetical protein
MDTFRQLQALTLVAVAVLIVPRVMPSLRRYDGILRLAALLLYLAGGAVILIVWLLTRD